MDCFRLCFHEVCQQTVSHTCPSTHILSRCMWPVSHPASCLASSHFVRSSWPTQSPLFLPPTQPLNSHIAYPHGFHPDIVEQYASFHSISRPVFVSLLFDLVPPLRCTWCLMHGFSIHRSCVTLHELLCVPGAWAPASSWAPGARSQVPAA